MRRMLKHRAMRGLTLLELVIAVLVLSMGSLAAVRATDQSRVSIGGMPARVLAQIVARNRVQELQLYGAIGARNLPGRVEMGGRSFQVNVETKSTAGGLIEASVTVRGQNGPGAYLVTYVTSLGPGS